jgi:hypothetical protein
MDETAEFPCYAIRYSTSLQCHYSTWPTPAAAVGEWCRRSGEPGVKMDRKYGLRAILVGGTDGRYLQLMTAEDLDEFALWHDEKPTAVPEA